MSTAAATSYSTFRQQGQYFGYCYSYPHKTAYRPFEAPLPLNDVWCDESKQALFLYLHIPFCEVRCGFCNLFTFSQPEQSQTELYLKALNRQAQAVRDELGEMTVSRVAIGGGTPTYLNLQELQQLLLILSEVYAVDGTRTPISCEVSPGTIDDDKLRLLNDFGVDRISIGVQSFDPNDAGRLGRPQAAEEVRRAIQTIRERTNARLNIDLIYGADSQTELSWLASLEESLKFEPQEVYLYPLYVRPLTGLGKTGRTASDSRPLHYRTGRDYLTAMGYNQVSMRMFEKPPCTKTERLLPDYCCQRDGMLGLGCGARSYTSQIHYGWPYAVGQPSILKIIFDYIQQQEADFRQAAHGIVLNAEDQRRRFLLMSLLLKQGLRIADFTSQFHSSPLQDFPELLELSEHGMLELNDHRLQLTELGLEWSDSIGPWLYSQRVQDRMREYPWNA
jgi:oxygen-independent coproporphyrinogen-3 oxidase